MKKKIIHRSSETGETVTPEFAAANKSTTQTETIEMDGVYYIGVERSKQKNKHGFTGEHSADHPEWYADGQLVEAAQFLLQKGPSGKFYFPKNWDQEWFSKLCEKPFRKRLEIAGALLAAELDRFLVLEERAEAKS